MLDFANWLCGRPERVLAAALPPPPGMPAPESATITLQYGDGSVAVVVYSGVGSPALPKERVEVFRGGWAWVLDDFSALTTLAAVRRANGGVEPTGQGTRRAARAGAARRAGARAVRSRPGSGVPGAERGAGRARGARLGGRRRGPRPAGFRKRPELEWPRPRRRRRRSASDVRDLRNPRHERQLRVRRGADHAHARGDRPSRPGPRRLLDRRPAASRARHIGGCRSSTSRRPATSRCRTRTAPSGSRSAARSTTTPRSGRSSRRRATSTARGPTPRRSSTSTRRRARPASSGSTGCSTTRSGTPARASCTWLATGSGKKPLYYAQLPGGFVFASEIKALLEHPALTPELDEEAFFHYLTFVSTPAPLTMFAGVRKLEPAERMTVRADGSITSEIYWTPMSRAAASVVAGATRARARGPTRGDPPRLDRKADDVRRPVRRLPLRRRRLVDERRADGGADGRAGAHVLGRLRRARALQRARVRAARREALRHRPPRDRDRLGRPRGVRPRARLPPGRADRGLGRRPAALPVEARAGRRHVRRPDRRGLGRALPRLPELHQLRPLPDPLLGAVPARASPASARAQPRRDGGHAHAPGAGRSTRRRSPTRRRGGCRSGAARSPTRAS